MSRPADSYRAGALAAGPLAIAVGVFGVSFGVLARGAGLGAVPATLMSGTTFAGSAQFAAVALLGQGGGVPIAIATVALLNSRYLPIGASVAAVLHPDPLRRFFEAQLVVDESWAISHVDGRPRRRRLLGAGALIYIAFLLGTAFGAIGGGSLGNPSRLGLDAAFPALFLALLATQLRSRPAVAAAGAGGLIALALVPLSPVGVPVLAASIACLLGLRR